MAFAIVNPLAARWERLGITCLLQPQGCNTLSMWTDCSTQSEEPRNKPPASARTFAHAKTKSPLRSASPSARMPAAQGLQASHTFAERAAQAKGISRAAPVAPAPPAKPKPGITTQPFQPLPAQTWPLPWQQLLKRSRPGIIAWTYARLGADLCGEQSQGKQERSAFLRRLLRDLGHEVGTHTFWPVCLPPDIMADSHDEQQSSAPFFWSGLHNLKVRGIVVMGAAAANAAQLPVKFQPLQQIWYRGFLVWMLWDVEDILKQDALRYKPMLAFLGQSFYQILRQTPASGTR
ncbi:MAG: hypothetical protein IJU37_11985 [Desulfovibrio sp.]|nr:hypothetical protein [Desulfovibrio sp.]